MVNIAHLSDAERMFFVTLLLGEFLAWTRAQAGTSSLRALLYMDEVFGYLPPVAEPPAKRLFLTLLKQARAHGVGLVLATQNPADVDYKALSNCGAWFLGRLQTERDKLRVLEGLEGAAGEAGGAFDRAAMGEALAGLKGRQFVVNNVHEDGPAFFTTRWALSYLAGPLTRPQIERLTEDQKRDLKAEAPPGLGVAGGDDHETSPADAARPVLPAGVEELALPARRGAGRGARGRTVLRPALLGRAKLHYVSSTYKLDEWRDLALCVPARGEIPDDPWDAAGDGGGLQDVDPAAPAPLADLYRDGEAEFAPAPAGLSGGKNYDAWARDFKNYLYRERRLTVYRCAALKAYSRPGEDERAFRVRLTQAARERRDLEVAKLRKKYATKVRSAERMIGTARRAVDREQAQAGRARTDSYLSLGSSLLGALFGRKLMSATTVRRAATGMRSVGRARQQASDVGRAQQLLTEREDELAAVEDELKAEVAALEDELDPRNLKITAKRLAPRKSDIDVSPVAVLWRPWTVDASGIAEPGWVR